MGIKASKKIKIKTTNIVVPNGYIIIKLGTFNVDIRNTVNIGNRIKDIVTYIFHDYDNLEIDIMCLQGINDYSSLYNLVRAIKKYSKIYKKKIYFIPEFKDIIIDNISAQYLDNNFVVTLKSFNSEDITLTDNKHIQNIILSKYPVVTSNYKELKNHTDMTKILGIQTIIYANISIHGNIISIYNTTLSKDIRAANITNANIRDKEIYELFKVIDRNKRKLNKKRISYYKTNIHLLIGTLNIKEHINNLINKEYTKFVKERHCVDIYRYLEDKKSGYTNTFNERNNYIFFILTKEIYDINSKYYNQLKKIKNKNDLFNLILKKYKIYFIDCKVRKDIDVDYSMTNFPIETIFMMSKNNH